MVAHPETAVTAMKSPSNPILRIIASSFANVVSRSVSHAGKSIPSFGRAGTIPVDLAEY